MRGVTVAAGGAAGSGFAGTRTTAVPSADRCNPNGVPERPREILRKRSGVQSGRAAVLCGTCRRDITCLPAGPGASDASTTVAGIPAGPAVPEAERHVGRIPAGPAISDADRHVGRISAGTTVNGAGSGRPAVAAFVHQERHGRQGLSATGNFMARPAGEWSSVQAPSRQRTALLTPPDQA
jgi:hypothetical protein